MIDKDTRTLGMFPTTLLPTPHSLLKPHAGAHLLVTFKRTHTVSTTLVTVVTREVSTPPHCTRVSRKERVQRSGIRWLQAQQYPRRNSTE